MSIRSLADFNGVASSTVRCVVGTGTVAIQVANAVNQVMRGVGTFVAIRGLMATDSQRNALLGGA